MRFGSIPVDAAEGAILAHSLALPSGSLKKGRRLSGDDVAALRAADVRTVIAALVEPGEVTEDRAAARIARALAGSRVRVAEAFTGRANLYAEADGVVVFDGAALADVNGIDESITLATVMGYERVAAGQMVATVKIIPFGVAEPSVAAAEAAAVAAKLTLAPFQAHAAGLVLTTLPGTKPSLLAKRQAVLAGRLQRLGSAVTETRTVAHTEAAVAEALSDLRARGCAPLLVFAASAIVDRADVIPAGLVAAGGRIERLGMPVDPGNLLLLGALDGVAVIGIPSCAGSPKLNGFDWVLERVLAGLTVTTGAIAAMGVGGLLKEIPSRPQPRDERVPGAIERERQAPRIACLILAAGRSTRMGSNKLLEMLGNKPIVRHVGEAAVASACRPIIAVTGNQSDGVAAALVGLDIATCHNSHFADGLSSSLRAGLAVLPGDIDGVLVTLGDMPEVSATHLNRLIAAFAPADQRSIVVPVRAGKRGNPILWSRVYFDEMAAVSGDTGAKHLLGLYADQVVEVELDTDAILVDIDTPEALAALRARHTITR